MQRHSLYTLALSSITLTSLSFATPAAAQVINFSSYASPTTTEYQSGIGAPVRAGGIDFYNTEAFFDGSRNVLGTWGNNASDPGFVNRPTNIGSSTALFATGLGEEIDMYPAGSDLVLGQYGSEFNLFSIDVGHLYSTAYSPFAMAAFNLTFFGAGSGTAGAYISQTFSIALPPLVGGFRTPVLQTLTFNSSWHDLTNVYWSQGTGSGVAHQFTNVRASVVPEPSTYAMMFAGLVLVGVAQRRRRKINGV